ncbi:MAG TPA: NAD(P)/FAD-dependent oxidoreductase [Streptosporangiaceae bacterium]|jgi:NADPH-dependent 2,4-dienoyl-CoA reductase/sulfur reductase-like enzyme
MNGSQPERIVIVGASLAGLRGAETLRREGYAGSLTIVGDEPHEPYDRPPLSKVALTGWVPPEHTSLPRLADLGEVDWRLGVPAAALDRRGKAVVLADGTRLPYDRVLIATGVRNRPWPHADQAALAGVRGIRTREDSRAIRDLLDAGPKRVVVGAGFTGSEVASVCRQRGLAVTVLERAENPLVGALGGVVGEVAASMQRAAGVDLRCDVALAALEGSGGRFRAVSLSDGTTIEADLAVIALGAVRNTEWLAGCGLAVGPLGISCDPGGRAYAINGMAVDDVFTAGDVARFPRALFNTSSWRWSTGQPPQSLAAVRTAAPPAGRAAGRGCLRRRAVRRRAGAPARSPGELRLAQPDRPGRPDRRRRPPVHRPGSARP